MTGPAFRAPRHHASVRSAHAASFGDPREPGGLAGSRISFYIPFSAFCSVAEKVGDHGQLRVLR